MSDKQMPEEGQTVEVVIRGPVSIPPPARGVSQRIYVGSTAIYLAAEHVVSVTVITPPLAVELLPERGEQ